MTGSPSRIPPPRRPRLPHPCHPADSARPDAAAAAPEPPPHAPRRLRRLAGDRGTCLSRRLSLAFVLALAPSDGPLYRGRLIRALAAFAVPAGLAIAIGSLASFFLVDTVFGGTRP